MSKVALVTGANRGIGLELCRQLHERGDTVIAACRQTSEGLASLGVRVETGVDVADEQAVTSLARRLASVTLDLLINNAGVLRVDSLGHVRMPDVKEQFEINALGPLRVTQALLKNLSEGAKVAIITSRMGSIEDNGSGAMYGYRMSKAALNAAGVSLARDLFPRRIAVVILHPGYVRTQMTALNGSVDPDEAARGLIARIDELSLESTGRFLHANGERLPW